MWYNKSKFVKIGEIRILEEKRIEWLDALKGVAIIAVVFDTPFWDIQKIMLLENTTISFSN